MHAGTELAPSLEIYINDLGQEVKGVWLGSLVHVARISRW